MPVPLLLGFLRPTFLHQLHSSLSVSIFDLQQTWWTDVCLDGRFSDIFGRKAAMCIAMGTYMFGCLLAGFSRSITALIVFRGIAGAGGGGIISVLQIVISDVVSLRDRYAVSTMRKVGFNSFAIQRKVPRYNRRRYFPRLCPWSPDWWCFIPEGVLARMSWLFLMITLAC